MNTNSRAAGTSTNTSPHEPAALVTSSGRLATVSDALRKPEDYVVQHDWFGWSLRHVGSHVSTLITTQQAFLVSVALEKFRKKFKEASRE